MVRFGVTPYLNARLLARGLSDEPGVELVYGSPARLADQLRAGQLDAAFVSSSEYFNGDYVIVPGCAISSRGSGADAMLFCNVPLHHLRAIALDSASRSTNLLLRLALHWLRPGAAINFYIRPADSCRSLQELDACLLIGDVALSQCHGARHRYDLAEIWYELTDLPMVLTVWLARPGADPAIADIISSAYRRGREQLEEVVTEAAFDRGWPPQFVRHYLTETLDYRWTADHEQSLRLFGEALYSLGLVEHGRALHYLGEQLGQVQDAAASQAT